MFYILKTLLYIEIISVAVWPKIHQVKLFPTLEIFKNEKKKNIQIKHTGNKLFFNQTSIGLQKFYRSAI